MRILYKVGPPSQAAISGFAAALYTSIRSRDINNPIAQLRLVKLYNYVRK